MTDSEDLATRLDRITYLLVAVVALQATDLLELGVAGLFLFFAVGIFVTALYNAEVA